MLKGLGELAGLMKQAQEIGGRMQSLTEELKQQRVVGQAGGGMVEIEMSGAQETVACRIDAALWTQQDRELLEDLIVAATNQALQKARQLHAESMQRLTGNLQIPGLSDALAKLADLPSK